MTRTRPPLRPLLSTRHVSKFTRDALDRYPDYILRETATGFFTPENRKLLNPTIMNAVDSIRTYIRFRRLSCTDTIRNSHEEYEFFYMRQCCVEYDLLSMPFDKSLPALTPLQNAVRLVLFVYGFATYAKFEPSSAYIQAIVAQLKESIELVDLPALEIPDLLLWTQFFGASISRLSKERSWFVTHLARTIHQLKLKSADDMEEILRRFFYMGVLSRPSLLEIWNEVGSVDQALLQDLPKRPKGQSRPS